MSSSAVETTAIQPPSRLQSFFYWLAGARWEILQKCPASEQERMAILGSTVLVPTVMSFLGMFFFAKSRFEEPPFLAVTVLSLLWAFVIMTTDRILITMYRPFQPFWKRATQVSFRLFLASLISLAIAFPFCLDQYRPAIRFLYQTELQGKLNDLRSKEAKGRADLRNNLARIREGSEADRRKLESTYLTSRESFAAQLPPLEKAQINPETYADEKMEEERRRASAPEFIAPAAAATLNIIAKLDASKQNLQNLQIKREQEESMHRRLVEAIAREELGMPNEFYPETKKPGSGPRLKDMKLRDSRVIAEIGKLELSIQAETKEIASLDDSLAAARLVDRNFYLDSLSSKRAAFVNEAEERERIRRGKLDKLNAKILSLDQDYPTLTAKLDAHVRALEEEQARSQQRHDDTFLPPIHRLDQKIQGMFDPMEETIGLYKVIFRPPPEMVGDSALEYRWAAALFQFLVVFGTLFFLDLIPIVVKMLTRPGPYDVLLEYSEFTANANWADFQKNFATNGSGWSSRSSNALLPDDLVRAHYEHPLSN